MIAAWMLFTLEISVLFFVAAWLAERALNAARRPVRWVWMTAMIATALLPLTALFAPVPRLAIPELKVRANSIPMMPGWSPNKKKSAANVAPEVHAANAVGSPSTKSVDSLGGGAASDNAPTPQSSTGPSNATIGLPSTGVKSQAERSAGIPVLPSAVASQLEVTPNSAFQRLNSSLLNAWLVIAGIGSLICLVAVARTMRQRGTWSGEYVDGTPVLVTHDVGPALIGVLQYSIVVPRWVFELEGRARKLILAHEREHARSYDPILLALGVFLVVIAPWNVVTWFMLRRLRLAIEMDCDQRVLRAHPDARSYSALLLDVAERTLPSVMPQAALVEYGTSLETRIRAMISPSARHRVLRVGGNLLAMGALVAVACVTPRPYASLPPTERVARLKSDLAEAEKSLPKANDRAESPKGRITVIDGKSYVEMPQTKADSARMRGMESAMNAYLKSTREKSAKDSESLKTSTARLLNLYRSKSAADDELTAQLSRQSESERATARMTFIKDAVLKYAPEKFDLWTRADSALVFLFNADGSMAAHSTMQLSVFSMLNQSAMNILMRVYFPQTFRVMDRTELTWITQDRYGQALKDPLKVVWAQLKPGATIPRTRREIIPSTDEMLESFRKTDPALFSDTASKSSTGMLLFDVNGKQIAKNVMLMPAPRVDADGKEQADDLTKLIRMAFPAYISNAVIMEDGVHTYFGDKKTGKGAASIMYAVIARPSDLNEPQNDSKLTPDGMLFGSSSRSGDPTSLDHSRIEGKILNLVKIRSPEAFGAWPRADTALVMLFDERDQLVVSGKGLIAQNAQLLYLASYLSNRIMGLKEEMIETVGIVNLTADGDGRTLNKPLQVVWGRVKPGTQLFIPKKN